MAVDDAYDKATVNWLQSELHQTPSTKITDDEKHCQLKNFIEFQQARFQKSDNFSKGRLSDHSLNQ
jgi:hypothetical protein